MVITILLLIPVIIAVTGFITYKGVQLGLRWQIEVRQEKPPTLESPIAPIVEARQEKAQAEQAKETESVFNEWVNGAQESR